MIRSSRAVGPDTIRYALRATPIKPELQAQGIEASRELSTATVLDKIAHRQAVPTPEATFEDLWMQLRTDLDLHFD